MRCCHGQDAIDNELKTRMVPMLIDGGYIACLDHTVPPNVSLHNFTAYIQRNRELSDEFTAKTRKPGFWQAQSAESKT
jgi:hypothetical protein